MMRPVLVLAVLGCGVTEPDATLPPDVEPFFAHCPPWECGSNNPVIDGLTFHDLSMAGVPNSQGFRVLHMTQGGLTYAVQVSHGRIVGTSPAGSISGSALTGALVVLVNGGKQFAIKIDGVATTTPYFISTTRFVESYRLEVAQMTRDVLGDFKLLCGNPPGGSGAADGFGMNAFDALVFEGDRIDADTKTDHAIDTTWFNIGCAGSALAKMYLTGHAFPAGYDGFVTTLAERTTMLKMFVADYCGTGKPFTEPGQPLLWKDDKGWMSFRAAPASLEARWTASGACLNPLHERALSPGPALGSFTFPGDFFAECGFVPPTCADLGYAQDGYHLITANP